MFLLHGYRTPPVQGDASFTVIWSAPETDADGSAVETVTSHKVYWSQTITDRENSAGSATVAMPTLTYVVSNIAAGQWYVWVAAVTATGESEVSPPLEVTAV